MNLVSPAVPTGKPGRPKNPERVIHADLDYATVHKTREGGRVVKVERRVVFGSEHSVYARLEDSPSHTINIRLCRTIQSALAAVGRTFGAQISHLRALVALASGQVRHLRGLLQFDSPPRNAQLRQGSDISAQAPPLWRQT